MSMRESDEIRPAAERLELGRKILHMLPGLIPFVMWFIWHEDPLPLWNLAVVASVIAILTLLAIRHPRGVRHKHGENWLRTCLTFAIPPFVVLLCFPGNAEYAAVVICVLAFGDSAAALGGRLFGTTRLPWNGRKTWVGLFCFIAVASVVASLAFWGEAHPRVSVMPAAICGTSAAVLGGLAETIPTRIDDNLRISIAAAVGVITASVILGTGA
jgi:dolichol kinase